MSIDDEIKAMVRAELAATLPVAIREAFGSLFQGDRRTEPRPAAKRLAAARKRVRGGKPKRTCPYPGCGNGWSPRTGGYCKDHVKTAQFRAWKAARGKGAKKR